MAIVPDLHMVASGGLPPLTHYECALRKCQLKVKSDTCNYEWTSLIKPLGNDVYSLACST